MTDETASAARVWGTTRLSQVAQIGGGMQKTPARAPKVHHRPYLTVRNVQRGYLDLSQTERFEVTPAEVDRLRLQPGDILIVEGNGSVDQIGRNAVFDLDGEEWVHQNHIIRVRLDRGRARPDFLALYLNSDAGKAQMVEKARSTSGLYTLSVEKVSSLTVPLPPLAEQERIATELTAGMAAADRARRAAADRLAAAEALPAAYLREAFEGPDAVAWDEESLGDSLADIEAGTSVIAEPRPARQDEWGVLKVSAVSWGRFKPGENKAVKGGYRPAEWEYVRPGDLLISRCNTAELAGAVILVRDTPSNLMLSDKTLRLVLKPQTYEPAFLELALRIPSVRRFIEGRATGTSQSMRNITQDTIRAIPLPRPPLTEQQRLVVDLSAKLAAADALIARCREELAAVEALPAALLRQVFSGTA